MFYALLAIPDLEEFMTLLVFESASPSSYLSRIRLTGVLPTPLAQSVNDFIEPCGRRGEGKVVRPATFRVSWLDELFMTCVIMQRMIECHWTGK